MDGTTKFRGRTAGGLTLLALAASALAPSAVAANEPEGSGEAAPGYRYAFLSGTGAGDRLVGGAGKDWLRGFAGPDRLWARGGADRLEGGAGPDLLVPGGGRDLLRGGAGADRADLRDGRGDLLWCGRGRDTVRADARDVLIGCELVELG
jgi:Ca2+-binding RTX toxin-like protein